MKLHKLSLLELCFFLVIFTLSSVKSVLVKVPGRLCVFKEGNQIYDLSELAARKHWIYTEYHPFGKKQKSVFLYSICHAVQGFSACNEDDGSCFLNGHSSKNLKTYLSGGKWNKDIVPELYEEGHMKLTYNSGHNCSLPLFNPNSNRQFTTHMYLQCPTGDEKESPGPTLMSSPHCSFIFVWVTKAACPLKVEVQKDSCIIESSMLDHPLNLHNLMSKSFYEVQKTGSTFEINICGPIKDSSCPGDDVAICDATNKKMLASNSQKSVTWLEDKGILVMKFTGDKKINLELHCDRTAFQPKIYYSSLNSSQVDIDHTFIVNTAVVCASSETECVVEDSKRNIYDLRSLHKEKGNWEVLGTATHARDKLFHINLCGPINHDGPAQCPNGPIGACRTSISSGGSQNIGYITSNPIVKEDGTIVVLYTGGESCRAGVKSSSSRISLTCSPIEHYPILVEITDACEHLFEWHTPAACPKNVVVGQDCRVTDPVMGWTFNLNPLRRTNDDYSVSYRYDTFNINPCGPLTKSCTAGDNQSSVCHAGLSGGRSPGKLIFNDGTLLMKYSNGSKCDNNQTYNTQILFVCNQNETKALGLQYLPVGQDTCTYNFIWPTTYACPSFLTVKCFVSTGDTYYDLSPLSNPSANEVYITGNHTKRYVLNVCRSVVHSKENRCPYHAGACLIDSNSKDATLNLGNVYAAPYVENGVLQIRYKNGDVCNKTHTYETVIYFKCSHAPETYPVLIEESDCKVVFEWNTVHACPTNLIAPTVHTGRCSVENPLTKFEYNMTELVRKKSSKLHITSDTYVLFNICGQVDDFECSNMKVGACFVSSVNGKKVYSSAGVASTVLDFNNWSPHLRYENGDTCSNGIQTSTRISFVCGENSSLSGPILIDYEQHSCTIFINWYTQLACERTMKCAASSWDRNVDLSRYRKYFGNYVVSDPIDSRVKYYLNVCKPLNPIAGVNCHPGSSACRVQADGLTKNIASLGHPYLNPVITSTNRTEIMYSHGSSCVDREDGPTFSSKISFVCDHLAGFGQPRFLKQTRDCQIQFEWRTSAVCDTPAEIETTNQCHIFYPEAKANIDLTPLSKPHGYQVPFGSKTFLVNVCGSVCNESGVCTKQGENFGLSSHSKLEWKNGALQLKYYSGDSCSPALTQRKSSLIFFECDMKAGYGVPVADVSMYDFQCMAIFKWATNMTCLESFYQPEVITQPPSSTTTAPSDSGSQKQVSDHTATSVAIAVVLLLITGATLVFIVTRTRQGREFVTRTKGLFTRKGDEAMILDDQFIQA